MTVSKPVALLMKDYEWVHLSVGLLGHSCFLVGSILFLWESVWQRAGVWLFIAGAAGMLIGYFGRAIVSIERTRQEREQGWHRHRRERSRGRVHAR